MPYAIKKVGNKWITYNKRTGQTKGTHDTREKAIKQMRLLYGVEHNPDSQSSAKKMRAGK